MLNWNYYDVDITCASIGSILTHIHQNGIVLHNVCYIDDLRIRASVSGGSYSKLKRFAVRKGATVEIKSKKGIYFLGQHLLQRPVLVVGLILWIIMVLYLPTRILFVYVDGNRDCDTLRIVEAASKCGIHFGASRRYVRSEAVKNKLLFEVDELQWVGVNTYGCVATISVKERLTQNTELTDKQVTSIVASQDGIISSITATRGNPVCKVGQAVRKGQVLVSAYTDCGISVKADSADAEVLAITNRTITAITLSTGVKRTKYRDSLVRYSIQIGKNIVKLYNDSGILDASCVKMYSQRDLTLPGGFQLPVSLITETLFCCDCEPLSPIEQVELTRMKRLAEEHLSDTMISGRIIEESESGELQGGAYHFSGVYICEEMIGQTRKEELFERNGKGNY